MRFLALALALLALAGCPRDGTAGPCPSAIVQVERYATAPPFQVEAVTYDSLFQDFGSVHVTFDRTQATLSMSASSGGRMLGRARVVESFDVTGVPPGTPVPANVELHVDGWSEQTCGGSGCGVICEAWLSTGTDSLVADGANHIGPSIGRRFVATTLSLPVTFIAGSPIQAQFFIAFGTGPGGGAVAEMGTRYAVSELPPGVRAVACAGADVTPARRTSWGRLKSIYR
jgi:hypothetical protein